jgi:photosystem II stability/assembly factor-like uncharacterized protein
MKKLYLLLGLILSLIGYSEAQKLDMEKLKGIKPRSIGPAGMSGRVTAIDVVTEQPNIIYLGTASGGLWKSTDGGIDWKPLFDQEKVLSIGAVAIDQSNPSVVWVGTGEGNPRNSQTMGAGVYRSLDGGKTWKLMGLEKTRTIHRILIHPTNPNIIYVGAQGSAWGDGTERGVFKTTDGGKTWAKVLYINEKTGVADMVIDPKNPNKLIVAMWEFRRQPWVFKSGGAGSGMYVTFDGGETWTKRTEKDGLPEGELGRMGLTIAKNNPNVVYALIESKKNGIYRSDDGGFTWRKITDSGQFGDRPFYYAEIYVDPSNENRLFSLFSVVTTSEDGGRTWRTILPYGGSRAIHPDHHAWYIHPKNPDFMIDGNDGGAAITYDRGKNWRFIENLPVAQYYHINVDNEIPYNVYGGMQDNGSWRGPAYNWRDGGIKNIHFEELSFGDGFDVVPDPSDNRYGYTMSQGGYLSRYDLNTGGTKLLKPVHPQGLDLRFNWNAGIAVDPFDKKTVYYGSQFLHKSTDRGENWTLISNDLTSNNPDKLKAGQSGGLTFDVTGAENHCTIIAIAPSPKQQGVIWVGTDDGNLQLTQDGGKTWTNVISNIKGVPAGSWIPQIRASEYNAGEAFVVINNYRREDWTPFLFQTKDFGKTWTRLVDENKVNGYCLSFIQDPIEPKLMFLGTEFGLYVSIDAGVNWTHWTNGYPKGLSTYDMAIQAREHDLVIGTFGRSAYVFDDIRPLREMAQKPAVMDKALHIFPTPEAVLANYRTAEGGRFPGNADFQGDNRPYGGMISFNIKEIKFKTPEKPKTETPTVTITEKTKNEPKKVETPAPTKVEANKDSLKITLEVLDNQRKVIRTLKMTPKLGLNRMQWGLNHKGIRMPNAPEPTPDSPEPGGMSVLPGTYWLRMTYGDVKDSTTVKVIADPREQISDADRQANFDWVMKMQQRMDQVSQAVKRINEAQKIAENIAKDLKGEDEKIKNLKKLCQTVQDSLKSMKEKAVAKEGVQGIFRDSDLLFSRFFEVSGYLQSSNEAPNGNQKLIYNQVDADAKTYLNKINAFFDKDWRDFQKAVEDAKYSIFKSYEPFKVE